MLGWERLGTQAARETDLDPALTRALTGAKNPDGPADPIMAEALASDGTGGWKVRRDLLN